MKISGSALLWIDYLITMKDQWTDDLAMQIWDNIEHRWINDLTMKMWDNIKYQWIDDLTMTLQAQAMAAASTDAPTTGGWIIPKKNLKKREKHDYQILFFLKKENDENHHL